MRRPMILALVLLPPLLIGCKRSSIERGSPQATTEGPTQDELVQAQKATSDKLEEIRGQIATLRNAAAAQQAGPDFVEDLAVATGLAGRLSAQASKQKAEEAEISLQRLVGTLVSLLASAPASRIQQHLERAEVRLTAGDLASATEEVLAAAGEAYNPSAPALVPDVLTQLEKASVSLKEGNATEAGDVVAKVMDEISKDATADDLSVAHLTALEATASLERKAWPILMAQAVQVSNLLKSVEKRATPQPEVEPVAGEAEAPEAAEAAEPEASATPEESAPAEAAGGAPEPSPSTSTRSPAASASESEEATPNPSP